MPIYEKLGALIDALADYAAALSPEEFRQLAEQEPISHRRRPPAAGRTRKRCKPLEGDKNEQQMAEFRN